MALLSVWILPVSILVIYMTCMATCSPVVNLADNAFLRGYVSYTHGSTKPVFTFTGVPFAQKPVRFLPAETLELWDGERDATQQGNFCFQNIDIWRLYDSTKRALNQSISEDCLHLNVWTPSLDVNSKLDVMFWIHGGGLFMGAASYYEGTAFASFHNVVFVSANYRLAGLGFLTTGDKNAPGNVGMHDQLEALRWVQRYIPRFGGDPQKVTIFGESIGGCSTSYLLVSPLGQNLFRRAISQSGTSLYSAHTAETSRLGIKKTKEIAQREGCPTEDNKRMVECLRAKPAEVFTGMGDQYDVMIDGHFLLDSPYNLYTTGQFHAKDYLLGFNTDEGYMLLGLDLKLIGLGMGLDIDITHPTPDIARTVINILVDLQYGRNVQIADVFMREYIGTKTTHKDIYRALVAFYGDYLMMPWIIDAARKHSTKKDTFLYQYSHRMGIVPFGRHDWAVADHEDEIYLALGLPFFNPNIKLPVFDGRDNYTDEDRALSKLMMSYWTNFAKTGDPNGKGLPHWPRYDCKTKKYMVLGTRPQVKADYEPELMKIWMEEIPKLDKSKLYKGFPWECPSHLKEEL